MIAGILPGVCHDDAFVTGRGFLRLWLLSESQARKKAKTTTSSSNIVVILRTMCISLPSWTRSFLATVSYVLCYLRLRKESVNCIVSGKPISDEK